MADEILMAGVINPSAINVAHPMMAGKLPSGFVIFSLTHTSENTAFTLVVGIEGEVNIFESGDQSQCQKIQLIPQAQVLP